MHMPKAVIFDMDGLMFDTERLGVDAWLHAAQKMNLNFTKELALKIIGVSWDLARKMMFDELGEFDFGKARTAWQESINDQIEKGGIPIKPGLIELLSFLDEMKLQKAIATSSLRESVMFYLKNAGIDERFDVIVTGDMVSRGKPAPDIYLLAAELLGVNPEECMVLEDSINGVKSASAAKIPTVMIPDLIPSNAQIDALLHAKLDSLSDVISLLKEQNQ